MTRALKALGWLAWTIVYGFGFCVFGWTGANMAPDPAEIPLWLWFGTMTVTAVGCLVLALYGVIAFGDSLLDKDDPRRLTK